MNGSRTFRDKYFLLGVLKYVGKIKIQAKVNVARSTVRVEAGLEKNESTSKSKDPQDAVDRC